MGLRDKEKCAWPGCGHPRHRHNGNHVKGSRTACRAEVGGGVKCTCPEFVEAKEEGE